MSDLRLSLVSRGNPPSEREKRCGDREQRVQRQPAGAEGRYPRQEGGAQCAAHQEIECDYVAFVFTLNYTIYYYINNYFYLHLFSFI